MDPQYTELQLCTDFAEGKRVAFDEIYDRYYQRIYAFTFTFVQNQEEAKDATAECFAKLFQLHANFDKLPNIQAFLYVAARNRSLNYLTYLKKLSQRNKNFIATIKNEAEQENDLYDGDLLHRVRSLIERLPEKYRRVIVMHYLEEMKYSEIAEELDMPVKKVDNLLNYAIKKLREHFEGNAPVTAGFIPLLIAFFKGL